MMHNSFEILLRARRTLEFSHGQDPNQTLQPARSGQQASARNHRE